MVKKFGDLVFLRHNVPVRANGSLCGVEKQIALFGPHKKQKDLVLRVLHLMTFTSKGITVETRQTRRNF